LEKPWSISIDLRVFLLHRLNTLAQRRQTPLAAQAPLKHRFNDASMPFQRLSAPSKPLQCRFNAAPMPL
jgi:hypothetical protein